MSYVWEHSQASGGDLLVLLCIADHADDYGCNAWPSQARLAARARLSVRSVQRSIQSLVDMGELAVGRHSGGTQHTQDRYRPNRYRVLMHRGDILSGLPLRGDICDEQGATFDALRGDAHVVLTTLEPSIEPSALAGLRKTKQALPRNRRRKRQVGGRQGE